MYLLIVWGKFLVKNHLTFPNIIWEQTIFLILLWNFQLALKRKGKVVLTDSRLLLKHDKIFFEFMFDFRAEMKNQLKYFCYLLKGIQTKIPNRNFFLFNMTWKFTKRRKTFFCLLPTFSEKCFCEAWGESKNGKLKYFQLTHCNILGKFSKNENNPWGVWLEMKSCHLSGCILVLFLQSLSVDWGLHSKYCKKALRDYSVLV